MERDIKKIKLASMSSIVFYPKYKFLKIVS